LNSKGVRVSKFSQLIITLILFNGTVDMASAADNVSAEATRAINASGTVRMIKATGQPETFPCIDKIWKKKFGPQMHGLYVANFTGNELRSIADFYETPLGIKYITAIETQAYNQNHPTQEKPIANFSDPEKNEIKLFYETPAGKKYLNSPEAQVLTNAAIRIGFDIAITCFKPK